MKRTSLSVVIFLAATGASAQSLPFRQQYNMSGLDDFHYETAQQRTTTDNQSIRLTGDFLLPQAMWRDDQNDPAPWDLPFSGALTASDNTIKVHYDLTQTIPTSGTYYWTSLWAKAQTGYETWRIRYQAPANPGDPPALSYVKSVTRHYNWHTPNGSPTLVATP